MTTSDHADRTLSPAQLSEVLGLLRVADSVELKLTVPDSNRRSTVNALDLDPLDAQLRQVVFFDTPDLDLSGHGVVVRARRIQGRPGDTVVKLRPLDPGRLTPELQAAKDFGVEVDAMPGGFVCSASMKASVPDKIIKSVLRGGTPVRKLLGREQRAFYDTFAPAGLSLDDLSALGPITTLKLRFKPKGFERRMVAELWLYPDGGRILELSTKCRTDEAFQVSAEAKAYLGEHGVDLAAEQQTKTKTAMEFYAAELRAARG